MAKVLSSWIPASPSFSATRTVGFAPKAVARTTRVLGFLGRGKMAREGREERHERETVVLGEIVRFHEDITDIADWLFSLSVYQCCLHDTLTPFSYG